MNYRFVLVDSANGQDIRQWILPAPVTIGRCSSADITINDASISRRHCQFLLDPYDTLMVRDLGSKNGIYIDDRRVDKSHIYPGTEVRIGKVTVRLELTDEPLPDAPETVEVLDLDETQAMKIIQADESR